MKIIYDIETFPNCFQLCARDDESGLTWAFEISPWRDDCKQIIDWMDWLRDCGATMVGFNNLGFDYPVIHFLYRTGKATAQQLYDKAMAVIGSENKFDHIVYPSDRVIPQIDLFKIHHFDNHARATSLKTLEFNMRLDNIHDLPFSVGTHLTEQQSKVLMDYCVHDVKATQLFLEQSREAIRFREKIAADYKGDVVNYSDVKLGKAIFQRYLEDSGVDCYDVGSQGRTPKQTPRQYLHLSQCIPSYISLSTKGFRDILEIFQNKVITETKGAFKDLNVRVGTLDYVFGTGGIHASVEQRHFVATDERMILDIDVSSMYPSIAIENGYYPEHLGPRFVDVYRKLRAERLKYAKGTVENAALKLALNGVYGASGDKFSIFYDPLFTMKVTVGGQLMMAMLVEQLLAVPTVEVIQANTDGVTLYLNRASKEQVEAVCRDWEQVTKLTLEYVEYSKMFVADVNSYLAQTVGGKVKRKGRYEYDVDWHQNASCLVVPKIAEQVLLEGANAGRLLVEWPDKMDFMLRAKVPKTSHLVSKTTHGEQQLENTQRYYISHGGGELVKVMPPLAKNPNEWRRIGINKGFTVCPCNDINEATLPIDYSWYLSEIDSLTYGVM